MSAFVDGDVKVLAERVLRSEGLVWRYSVDGVHVHERRLSPVQAIEALEQEGYGVVSARGVLAWAEARAVR